MFRFGQLWLFFCLLREAASAGPNMTVPPFTHTSGSADCDPDMSLLYDAKWYFVLSGSCQLLANSYRPINVSEVWISDNNSSLKRHHFCTLLRPSIFPVSPTELGSIRRTGRNEATFFTMKLGEWQETVALDFMHTGNTLHLDQTERTCHFHRAMKIIRCLSLDVKDGEILQYTDYEGDNQGQIRPFRRKKWNIPPSANIKGLELLSYYDDYTQTDRIWMEHNLQWLYNLDMNEQDQRGNKTARLTTYHLGNRDADRPFMVSVYSDSNSLVTAHCSQPGFDCRYIYNRVDAKSALDGTCLLELPYLTVVGIITPLKRMNADTTSVPPQSEALVQEEQKDEKGEGLPGFGPIYWLVTATFFFVLSMLFVHFLPGAPDDMVAFYDQLDENVSQWADEFRTWMHIKKQEESTKNFKGCAPPAAARIAP